MNGFMCLGLIATLSACICIYLASPHQRLRAAAWAALPARGAGLLLLVFGLWLLMQIMQILTAVFLWATVMMLGLLLLPYIGALLVLRRPS